MTATAARPDTSTALLDVSNLDVRLGRGRAARRILHDINVSVQPGEIVGLIGETGSGKTTLARAILGLADAERGRIVIADHDTTALSGKGRREFRRGGTVQFVFQDPLRSMDPDRTVAQSVAEGLQASDEHSARSRAEIDALVDDALRKVGLDVSLRSRRPAEISGGQRQRVAIARAIVCRPRLLICDEPVSALDASNRNKILRLLADLRTELGIAILVIAHDLSSLAGIADRVLVLYRGELVEDGPIDEVFRHPRHPYTGLLLASAPTVGQHPIDPVRLRVVRSDVSTGPNACVFTARCPFATEICSRRPADVEIRPGWRAACHHTDTWWDSATG